MSGASHAHAVRQGAVSTVVTGGGKTDTVPPHWHWHVAPIPIAGTPAMNTSVGGVQGAGRMGTHGAGPSAATTAGFSGLVHSPNGGTLVMGMWSSMVATGTPAGAVSKCGGPGGTTRVDGVRPRRHINCDPAPARGGMCANLARMRIDRKRNR
jgi:hypothetical protein